MISFGASYRFMGCSSPNKKYHSEKGPFVTRKQLFVKAKRLWTFSVCSPEKPEIGCLGCP